MTDARRQEIFEAIFWGEGPVPLYRTSVVATSKAEAEADAVKNIPARFSYIKENLTRIEIVSADEKRTARRERFRADLARALTQDDCHVLHPRPWTCSTVINNGPGAQFFDANGKPVLTDLIRDPEDAAQLLFSINTNT